MVFLILFLFLAVEVAGVWLVGDLIGSYLLAVWLAVATTIAGLTLLKRAQAAWSPETAMQTLARDHARAMPDMFAPIVGAALLVVPGFFTDILGVILLVPFTRGLLIVPFRKVVAAGLRRATKGGLAGMGRGFPGMGEPPGFDELRRQWEEVSSASRSRAEAAGLRREGKIKDAEFTIRDGDA